MNYHNITYPDMNNGDGLRVVLWLSGCSHHCPGCQNPQTWNENNGILFDEETKKELFNELSKDYISGFTLSGGDPLNLNNINEVFELIDECRKKFPEKTIWLYSGYTWEQLFEDEESDSPEICENQLRRAIVLSCDVFVDGEYVEALRDVSLKWRGSSNQKVIDVQETLTQHQIILHCD